MQNIYTNVYRLGVGLAGQNWSNWLLWLPKTLRNTVKIMLTGFYAIIGTLNLYACTFIYDIS